MATRERPRTAREPLDETDVDRAMADEPALDEEPASEPFAPSEPERAEADAPTTEDLEEELEDGTSGPEEQALHPEDEVTEVLDDERDAEDRDFGGDAGEELEWRMAAERDEDMEPRAARGAR